MGGGNDHYTDENGDPLVHTVWGMDVYVHQPV